MPNSWRLKGSSPEHSNTHAPQHRVAGLSQFFGPSSSQLDMWDMKAGIQFFHVLDSRLRGNDRPLFLALTKH